MLNSMAVAASDAFLCRSLPSINFKNQVSALNGGRKLKVKSKFSSKVQDQLQVRIEKQEQILSGLNLGFDVVSEGELRDKGFMGMRKTKMVCTLDLLVVQSKIWRNWLWEVCM
ncbi:hypothetical protein Ddye_016644 [Dipteronia dyeriana]|uniref:Uncharacterized protein n=1 Tax=Dipteronia dyeriana TaxID=168575 RepID=A0AAD9X0N2_9ROSI|nr:hypothetical protein Ddye_016644 [Dipteronia dyeriana]